MIDVHSHIVFGVDDGAETIEQSIEMIKEANLAGFDKVIATPHYMDSYYEINKNEINSRIMQINNELQQINCSTQILQGNEIYFTRDINELIDDEKATTLAESKYVLFELPLNSELINLDQIIYQILEKGRIPVLAHPERYAFVQKNPNVLIPLIENGVIIQCNYGSIIGRYNENARKTIKKMLEHNMVHLLGSDAHRQNGIYLEIPSAIEEIENIIGQSKTYEITTTNPEMIINGEEIEIEDPTPIKMSFFDKLKN